jgi:hypothetical protein
VLAALTWRLVEQPWRDRTRVSRRTDSFGEDVVNALHEGGWLDRVQLSTRYVAHYCGNLYLPLDAFTTRPADYDLTRCPPTLLAIDDALRARMQEADAIWLASMWQDWQVPLLPRSLEAIRAVTSGRPVVVFGPKSFGTFRLRDLLGH